MEGSRTLRWLRYVGWFVAIAYIAFGIFDFIFAGDPWGNRAFVAGLLVVGGALILFGLRTLPRSPWAAAAMISVGAVMGALPVFWSVLAPALAISLVVLSIASAQRLSSAPA